MRLARIVHAADISADLDTDPRGAGLLVDANDLSLLVKGSFVYDALYV
jgi:hypothetical protein